MIRRRALTLTSLRHQFDSYRNSNTNPTIRPFSTSPISYYTRFFSSSSQTQRRLNVRCLASHNSFPSNSISSNDLKNGISGVRSMSTRTMNGSTNRPPNETILLEGCDMEHWLVVVEPPDPNLTRDDIIDSYIKTLAQVLGSEEKARMKIYSVSTKHYFAFGCIVPEELSSKIKELPKVRWVLPDSYIDVRNKDYGGEPFINGQAVPYDPKYHELWVRNYNDSLRKDSNKRDRTRTGDRPRNNRRRDNITNQEMQHPPPPPPTQTSNPNTLATNVPNQNFTPTPNYQNQAPSMPTLAPNSGMPSPMQNHGVRRVDMPPQAPTNSFQNRNMPPTSGFQNRGMPPQVPNTSFQNRSMPPPMPRQNYQNVQQPMQNQDFPSRDVPPPPMVSGDVRNRNMPPPTQNWNYQSRNNPPPMQNHNFLDRDMSTPLQNHASQSRSMPEAVQNREYPNRGTHSLVQNQEYPKPSPMQNQNFYNRVAPLSIENHDLQDRDKPPPVESRNFSHMGVVRNGQYTRNDQSIDHQQWGTSDSMNMGNSPNRDHQSLHGDYEAVANRNF